nr:MAG TPA: hypothetical protein [Caudoviricetes sp.]
MKIDVKYIEEPATKVKVSFKEAGQRGGSAKVPKGFAKMNKAKRIAAATKGAMKRWGKENVKND